MPDKKSSGKKRGFSLVPITLSQPIKQTDGFTNLIEILPIENQATNAAKQSEQTIGKVLQPRTAPEKKQTANDSLHAPENLGENSTFLVASEVQDEEVTDVEATKTDRQNLSRDLDTILKKPEQPETRLSEKDLLYLLDADSLEEIYELSDVLRASSLKLYATLAGLADERGRARVKNHELMSKSGIKGIATLYKQERWLMDLKLLEKKAKPGPHDGSLYTVYKLERLPLPAEIHEKFRVYMLNLK